MVQRLAQIGKVYEKEKQEKRLSHAQEMKKREQKITEKREARNKELRKERYKKTQGKLNKDNAPTDWT